jgi:hypothetical protein
MSDIVEAIGGALEGRPRFLRNRAGNSPTVPIPLLSPPVSLPPRPFFPCVPWIECPISRLTGVGGCPALGAQR